ncbi:Rqc2 family fibronectin-binding protein [Gracilibacillus alcaliphilus]|uniref:Rqc2 family fibronectin-binding protein n=1 Tax=Gracilibacillus alcaliphilus TaxID=1401441 RepID=UPI00195BF1C9|nr:NFACT RNA binding domain-containing protein [Gracilibacillus alcaliphilus]MBM7678348.1 putative ribosome quality control (RQC) complex YloA/Tae2 family protein [Gracilibacillus alcaliphilus]
MVFDGVVTRAITHELQEELTSARVLKIYQPTDTELLFTVRQYGKNKQLLISAHSSYARIHLTADSYHNPSEPSMYCMMLRKYLNGSFIESVEQIENERIIHIHFQTKNEIGDKSLKTLVIEIMGKHSNIILLDHEKQVILDSIKHVSHAQNRHRSILPGSTYVQPPTQDKINPLTAEGDTFIRKLDFNAGKLDKQIVSTYMGVSTVLAQEIVSLANLGSAEAYKQAFLDVQQQIIEHHYQPYISQGKKEFFYVLPLLNKTGEITAFETISAMLDSFYSGKAERDRVKQKAGDLSRFLTNELKKNQRKLVKLDQTLEEAAHADNYQLEGELLTAHMHLVKKGDKEVEVIDYYDPEQKPRIIKLNEHKSPSENAQALFKRYQKLKKSKQMVEEEKQKTYKEIAYLEEIIEQIESAREQDIEEIREELQEQGYLKRKSSNLKQKKKTVKPTPESYLSSDGTEILVGKNNKQNEYLTNRLARKDEVWLHTKDIPGSHVVIRSTNPSEDTLQEAAQLAANFSKSKHSSSVPVDYTLIRHVKKPNGAKPGFVTYDNQKTLFVTPDAGFIAQLKKK